ncbi:MAG: hypothetical protein M0P73_08600 [Syntrophobacterales bacterium]|jgi:hypothetical protein|nr:hypothetical protein [Syntrophobacterales bacterium]
MKRYRWLGARWPEEFNELASKMKAIPFTQDSYDGFILERVRDTSIEARYIEKLISKEKVLDPFGNEEIFNYVTYRQVAFTLFDEFPNIELWDPPRSINVYLSRLLELSNFSLSVNHLQINLLDWVAAFQDQLNRTIVIDSLQISGLEIENGVNAKVLLKGDKDVRAAVKQFTNNRQYILEKLQLKVKFDRKIASIHLGNMELRRFLRILWKISYPCYASPCQI